MDYTGLINMTDQFRALAADKPYYIGKSDISGRGLIAARPISKGTNIGMAVSDGGEYITFMGSQINHQTNCNAKLVENKDGSCALVATKDIHKGEEITANYKDTPWYIDKDTKGFVEL
jgi:SET domain-containing protein